MSNKEKIQENKTETIISGIKVVVLDFDNNVILDLQTRRGSEEVKKEAWHKVFPDYDKEELKETIKKANKVIAGGKGDRRDVIKMILEHFEVSSKTEKEINNYSDLFNEIVQKGVISIGIPKENRRAIEQLSQKTNLYINTATPTDQSKVSLQLLGVINLFKGIYGRPANKIQNLKEIIKNEGINPNELLFVGDQNTDWEAAKETGCQFVGMDTVDNVAWRERRQSFNIIYSLEELLEENNLVSYETK